MPGVDVLVLGVDELLCGLNDLITRLRGLADLLSRAGDDPCGAGLTERAVNNTCQYNNNSKKLRVIIQTQKSGQLYAKQIIEGNSNSAGWKECF